MNAVVGIIRMLVEAVRLIDALRQPVADPA
jgi:hypothetical protein